jgi:glucan 1,3-beta-glucosidase
MSYRKEKIRSLLTPVKLPTDTASLVQLFHQTIEDGMHGICFSLYEKGQKPGSVITETQVRRRMEILKPYVKWIRSFSCTDGNELIPKIAKEYGLKTLVGAWLGSDKEINRREINGLKSLAAQGLVDVAAVGNEVMYRHDLSEDELICYISEVKDMNLGVPVGYVDAYYEFVERPRITQICDVILCNCYPFWEECQFDYSIMYMKQMFDQASEAAQGKRVIITETGWPSKGQSLGAAVPSEKNALSYFINARQWSKADDIEMFYFSSFDESWKKGPEGDVGAYWGLWDENEKLKW